MQATSELYKSIARTRGHRKEVMVRIAGRDYEMETDIVSLSTSGGAFPEADSFFRKSLFFNIIL